MVFLWGFYNFLDVMVEIWTWAFEFWFMGSSGIASNVALREMQRY